MGDWIADRITGLPTTTMKETKKKEIITLLGELQLFSMLSETELAETVENSQFKKYKIGETIASDSPCLPVIISGKAVVLGKSPEKSGVVLRVLKPGSVFGVSGLFCEGEEKISTVQAEKETEALLIPQTVIRDLIHKNGDFAEGYIRLLGAKIRYLGTRIEAFTAGSAEAKLAKHLLTLVSAEDRGEGEREITLEYSLSRLADMLSIGRASLYRAIAALEEKGFITHTDRHVTVKDGEALEQWARNAK